tara:strand:- start:1213 stop:1956 length:744 start_codon:yes stop_codon:yes gene_type:complete
MPEVTVIIPYYKKIDYIEKTIESVLNQTHQDFEIILIYDDIKQDDFRILKKKYNTNNKIIIVNNEKNLGAGISRNKGIKLSKGKFIAFIDSDDIWLPSKLESQLRFIKQNNYDFVFCDYKKIISKNKTIEVVNPMKKITYNDLIKSCDIGLSTVLIRKNVVNENLFPATKTKEDFIAWLKLTKKNINAYNLNDTLVIWNSVQGSLSSNLIQKIIDGFRVYYFYENFNIFKSIYYLFLLSFNSIKKKF